MARSFRRAAIGAAALALVIAICTQQAMPADAQTPPPRGRLQIPRFFSFLLPPDSGQARLRLRCLRSASMQRHGPK